MHLYEFVWLLVRRPTTTVCNFRMLSVMMLEHRNEDVSRLDPAKSGLITLLKPVRSFYILN